MNRVMLFLRTLMRKIFIFIVGLLVLVGLGYTCVYNKAEIIQFQLSQQIKQRLADESFEYVALHVDGRNVLLTGKVKSNALKKQAENLAKAEGVYHLDNQIEVVVPAS